MEMKTAISCIILRHIIFFQSGRRHTRYKVTGVQTCALPIFRRAGVCHCRSVDAEHAGGLHPPHHRDHSAGGGLSPSPRTGNATVITFSEAQLVAWLSPVRSEERRVGEEWRSRWLPDH